MPTVKKKLLKGLPAPTTGAHETSTLTARQFIDRLKQYQSDDELEKISRYFKSGEGQYAEGDQFMGIKMGVLFSLAKEFAGMPVPELEKLLENKIHEIRAGAISIMDKESRSKSISQERLKEMFNLYLQRHDRINNWDPVDLGCLNLTGKFLFDKPRTVLYKLAKSKNVWERRSAIVSTTYFIRQNDTDDTFALAEILVDDKEDLVHKGTGWMLRFAGDKKPGQLLAFLDKHAARMPRTLLRYAIEKLEKKKRDHYLNLKKAPVKSKH